MTKDPFFESRRETRIRWEDTLSIERIGRRGGLAQGIDISAGGIRFLCNGPKIEPEEKILVHFTLGSITYSFCGEPARVSNPGPLTQEVALTFTGADSKTKARLRRQLG